LFHFYLDLNLLDWSCNDHLAVALGGFVYLWNASTGSIQQLCQMDSSDCYVCSVSWIKEGNYLAIGDSDGAVKVYLNLHISCYLNFTLEMNIKNTNLEILFQP
jgi:WD40 repeat protein